MRIAAAWITSAMLPMSHGGPMPPHCTLSILSFIALLLSASARRSYAQPSEPSQHPNAIARTVLPSAMSPLTEPLWSAIGSPQAASTVTPLYPTDPVPDPHDAAWNAMPLPCFSLNLAPSGLAEHDGKLVIAGRFGSLGTTRAEHVLT